MTDFTDLLQKIRAEMPNIAPIDAPTPEQDAARKAKYEAEQEDKKALLRGLRNQMRDECERFNADYKLQPDPEPDTQTVPLAQQSLITKREALRLTQTEWDALRVQADFDMHSVAQCVSMIVRRHLLKTGGTIQGSNTTHPTNAPHNKKPVGRPPAPRPPMQLEPWTPAIWEDEIEAWHTQAAERNSRYSRAEVRVAHDLYLETLFAHLQRVGFPHPFKAGFTAI
jgi:hypothetical protein